MDITGVKEWLIHYIRWSYLHFSKGRFYVEKIVFKLQAVHLSIFERIREDKKKQAVSSKSNGLIHWL